MTNNRTPYIAGAAAGVAVGLLPRHWRNWALTAAVFVVLYVMSFGNDPDGGYAAGPWTVPVAVVGGILLLAGVVLCVAVSALLRSQTAVESYAAAAPLSEPLSVVSEASAATPVETKLPFPTPPWRKAPYVEEHDGFTIKDRRASADMVDL